MYKKELINYLKGGLIVSCQALEHEPLHSSYIMSKMAYAAILGGARGIRTNSIEDYSILCFSKPFFSSDSSSENSTDKSDFFLLIANRCSLI